MENLNVIDLANRCYLWRVLFDHVHLLRLSPMDYITVVQSHLLSETEGEIIPHILDNVCWIFEHDLCQTGQDK